MRGKKKTQATNVNHTNHMTPPLPHAGYFSFIKHLPIPFFVVGSGPRWVTVPRYYLSHQHPRLWVCIGRVFVFCGRGEVTGRTNKSFWVSGCRANIDQRARRHAEGQIKHSSDGHRAQRANDTPYRLDELASVCQTDHQYPTEWGGVGRWGDGVGGYPFKVFILLGRPGERGLACVTDL